MTSFSCKSVFAGVALVATLAVGDIPLQMHPDFELKEVVLPNLYKTTGMEFLSDGRLVIATTDFIGGGELPPDGPSPDHKVLIISNPGGASPTVKEVANKWLQPIGVTIVNDKVYISDRDGFYEILDLVNPSDLGMNRKKIASWPDEGAWNVYGKQWHQWVFTPVYANGFFYAPYSGSIQNGGPSKTPATTAYSGAFLKWDLSGKLEKFAGGLRSPNGANIAPNGDMFVADNQGSWLPASTFMHMKKDKFYGHKQTGNPPNWAESLPYEPPTAWLPYGTVRSSPSQPLYVDRGRYQGDWLLGDENSPGLVRIGLDNVEGTYNGAVFWFGKGFKDEIINNNIQASAISRMAWGKDGSFYVGTIQKLGNWPGETSLQPMYKVTPKATATAFDIKGIRHLADGVEIEFTEPVNPATITIGNFPIKQWNYTRKEGYGDGKGPEIDLTASGIETSTDGKRVHLIIPGLSVNYLAYFKLDKANVKSATGALLWNNEGWFTLNKLSTRKWDGTVSIADPALKSSHLNGLLRHRASATGLEVILDASGPMSATLRALDGSSVSKGTGTGSLNLSTQGLAKGLYFLEVRHGAEKLVRSISLTF
ncbi:MAG: hypothetical protein M3Y08_06945 [Fibrobacterota bacterium]|nr:hypothetical protein [Fibrobacterota bacterium]